MLSTRAAEWACDRVAALERTPSSIARDFAVAWSTVWSAVERIGRARVDDAERVGSVAMVGFDETVMQPAHRTADAPAEPARRTPLAMSTG